MASNSTRGEFYTFFDDLVRCETRLYNALGSTLRVEHGITTSQFELLRLLRDHPGARVADVAAAFAAGIGAASKMTDRLDAAGWVARREHPSDRRSSLLDLTPAGRRLVDAAQRTFDRRLSELLTGPLSTAQIRACASSMRALRVSLEDAGLGLPAG